MKWWMGLLAGFVIGLGVGYEIYVTRSVSNYPGQLSQKEAERPLLKYTIESLAGREYSSKIILDGIVATEAAFFVQRFHFDSDGKAVTGLAHMPRSCEKCPIIIQYRGYAESEKYYQGYGTKHSAETFAARGFISLAPDFLGYWKSASPSADVFEARFETYTTALNILAAAENWEMGNGKIGIWGHSNGGQITLTVSEISQKDYPVVLWAPVSAGFPYSILYYMDGNEEGDRELRKKLVDFENVYDTGLFNLINYLNKINAPIQLHQGTGDKSVPEDWSRRLIERLNSLKKKVNYYEYPGADHNLIPDWGLAVERDVQFFIQNLGLTE